MTSTTGKALGLRTALNYLIPVALVVLLLDQLTKVWALHSLELGAEGKRFIGSFIQLRLIHNSGAALSMASGMTWILTVISVAVIVFICISARRFASKAWVLTLGLLLGGALGNLGDRLFRAPGFPQGHVVDFIDYGPFIGNVADIAIVIAAILIAALSLFGVAPFEGRESE